MVKKNPNISNEFYNSCSYLCTTLVPLTNQTTPPLTWGSGGPVYVHMHDLAGRAQFKCNVLNYLQKTVGKPIVLC